MLFAVEIDNSYINFGIFEGADAKELKNGFKVATDIKKTVDEYVVAVNGILAYHGIEMSRISGAVISSVVPQLTETILAVIKRLTGVEAMTVGKGTKTGFAIKIDNPADLGADLVANAAAVVDIKNSEDNKNIPCVIIDMGTATTVFALNARGEYIGGSIMAGVGLSLDALHVGTAQLPNVSPMTPTRAIGKNSQESVRSGVILGNAMMIDAFIDRFSEEMKSDSALVFITGEYADTVIPACKHTMRHVPDLTLMGLRCIYKINTKV